MGGDWEWGAPSKRCGPGGDVGKGLVVGETKPTRPIPVWEVCSGMRIVFSADTNPSYLGGWMGEVQR